MTDTLLKLKAKDAEDIQVISAVLQDSIVPVGDMVYNSADKNFIMVAQRIRRETGEDAAEERICCAVNVRGIENVQLQGINLATQQGKLLDLLAVIAEGKNATFIFAGGAKIRLVLGDWSMLLEDFGKAWPSQCKPCHAD